MKIKFSEIWKLVSPLIVTALVGIVIKNLFESPKQLQWLYLSGIILFGLILGIIQILSIGWKHIFHWIKTPQPNNIKLTKLQSSENEIHLKITNKEWREPKIVIYSIELWGAKTKSSIAFQEQLKSIQKGGFLEIPFIARIPGEFKFTFGPSKFWDSYRFPLGIHNLEISIAYDYQGKGNDPNIKWYSLTISNDEKAGLHIINIQHADKKSNGHSPSDSVAWV